MSSGPLAMSRNRCFPKSGKPVISALPDWESRGFTTALSREKPPRRGKLQARDYQTRGKFPVIDQGQSEIAGWTDDETLVIDSGFPYVVFGDHTRTFKYVDRPFVLGADGTQLLRPSKEYCPRFFYYACLHLDLPSRGYNRHFSFLKEKSLPLPGMDEQGNIAFILWKLQRAIATQDRLIAATGDLKQSAMRHLFTHGLRGRSIQDTEIGSMPSDWMARPLEDLLVPTSTVSPAREPDRIIQYVDVSAISRDELAISSTAHYRLADAPSRARKLIRKNDTIFATVRPTLLRVALVPRHLNNQVCSTAFCPLRANPEIADSGYIFYVVQRSEFIAQLAGIESGASYPAVTDGQVKAQLVPAPTDVAEQRDIAATLATIDRKLAHHRRKRAALEALFQTTLHQLMTGHVRVADLDIDTSEVATPAEAQGEAA